MKKGFTLIELLSVIILLGVIGLITYPIINNSIRDSKEKAYLETIQNIEDAAYRYSIGQNLNYDGNYHTISIADIQNVGLLKDSEIVNPKTNQILNGCVVYKWKEETKQYEFKYDEECNIPILYIDNSGANQPLLLTKMIPIKHDGTNWVYADIYSEWYNYDRKEWANAVVLKSGVSKTVGQTITEDDIALWYVWIPRYKYTIFNGNNESVPEQEIKVTFENGTSKTGTVKCTDATNGSNTPSSSETCTDSTNGSIINGTSTYTHPAFTFGSKELTGIWVGKFENSGTTSEITIKPNVSSLRNMNVSAFFTAIQNVKTTYGITNGDSHMMKNMEWGAVAYFKQSKYGLGTTDIGINNNSNFITGCGSTAGSEGSAACNAYDTANGKLASTTGNIYGIYDMSGGAWEYVMGNMVNSSNAFYASNSGFSNTPSSQYYDSYTYDTTNVSHGRGKLGDATKETLATFGNTSGGWNSDYASSVYSSYSWFVRGGDYDFGSIAGVFLLLHLNGGTNSNGGSRSVLVPQ